MTDWLCRVGVAGGGSGFGLTIATLQMGLRVRSIEDGGTCLDFVLTAAHGGRELCQYVAPWNHPKAASEVSGSWTLSGFTCDTAHPDLIVLRVKRKGGKRPTLALAPGKRGVITLFANAPAPRRLVVERELTDAEREEQWACDNHVTARTRVIMGAPKDPETSAVAPLGPGDSGSPCLQAGKAVGFVSRACTSPNVLITATRLTRPLIEEINQIIARPPKENRGAFAPCKPWQS